MKHRQYLFILIFVCSSSCATLNVSEIKNLEKVAFDSLLLKPDREINNLRIDLIRQTYEEEINDSTKETKDTPYHPLGFNLGNGLFYDLNENLCIRIEDLMGFSSDENFEIHKINKPEKNKGIRIYKFTDDSLTFAYPPGKKTKYSYHRIVNPDSILYMYKNRLKYRILENDTSLIYAGKRRQWDVIHKMDENHYYRNKKRWRENYQMNGNEILLENDYILSLQNNNSALRVLRQGKRKNRVLFTIEKSKDKLFVYNDKYSGIKIELVDNELFIYKNITLATKYELRK